MKRLLGSMNRRGSKCASGAITSKQSGASSRLSDQLIGGERDAVGVNGDSPEANVSRGVVSSRSRHNIISGLLSRSIEALL